MSRTWDIRSADGQTVVRFASVGATLAEGGTLLAEVSVESRPWDRRADEADAHDRVILRSGALTIDLAALTELDLALGEWLAQPLARLADAPFIFSALLSSNPSARLELGFGAAGPEMIARPEECACRMTLARGRIEATVTFRMDPASLALMHERLEDVTW